MFYQPPPPAPMHVVGELYFTDIFNITHQVINGERPETVRALASQWGTFGTVLKWQAARMVERVVESLDWQGETQNAFQDKSELMVIRLTGAGDTAIEIAGALWALAGVMDRAKQDMQDLWDEYETLMDIFLAADATQRWLMIGEMRWVSPGFSAGDLNLDATDPDFGVGTYRGLWDLVAQAERERIATTYEESYRRLDPRPSPYPGISHNRFMGWPPMPYVFHGAAQLGEDMFLGGPGGFGGAPPAAPPPPPVGPGAPPVAPSPLLPATPVGAPPPLAGPLAPGQVPVAPRFLAPTAPVAPITPAMPTAPPPPGTIVPPGLPGVPPGLGSTPGATAPPGAVVSNPPGPPVPSGLDVSAPPGTIVSPGAGGPPGTGMPPGMRMPPRMGGPPGMRMPPGMGGPPGMRTPPGMGTPPRNPTNPRQRQQRGQPPGAGGPAAPAGPGQGVNSPPGGGAGAPPGTGLGRPLRPGGPPPMTPRANNQQRSGPAGLGGPPGPTSRIPEAFLPPGGAGPPVLGDPRQQSRRSRPGGNAEAPSDGLPGTPGGGIPPVLRNQHHTGPQPTYTQQRDAVRRARQERIARFRAMLKSTIAEGTPTGAAPVLDGRLTAPAGGQSMAGDVPVALRGAREPAPADPHARPVPPADQAARRPVKEAPAGQATAADQETWDVETPGGPVVSGKPPANRRRPEPAPRQPGGSGSGQPRT